jgi:hypothetical protein
VRRGVVMVKQRGLFRQSSGRRLRTFLLCRRTSRNRTRDSQFGLFGPGLLTNTTAVQMASPVHSILDTTSYIPWGVKYLSNLKINTVLWYINIWRQLLDYYGLTL